jgi:hypothetical protein
VSGFFVFILKDYMRNLHLFPSRFAPEKLRGVLLRDFDRIFAFGGNMSFGIICGVLEITVKTNLE